MATNDDLQLGDFDRIDSTVDPGRYVEWMDHQRRGYRDRGLEQLGLGSSDRVLDVGCGPGNDLHRVAEPSRFAVGLDLSTTMAAAAAEMARVLKPGGRLVLSEPDHGSHIVTTTAPDVFDRIKRNRHTKFRNPFVGRSLPDLTVGAGLTTGRTWATPIVHTSLASARAAGGPFDRAVADAVADGKITAAEANEYVASLVDADARGGFVFSALAVSVAATKPGPA